MTRCFTSLILYLTISYLHPTLALDAADTKTSYEIIPPLAIQTHAIACSSNDIDSRLQDLETIINTLQICTSPRHSLESPEYRYALLLECLAWDIYDQLKLYQGMFALEGSFDHERPPKHLITTCVDKVISIDIQNKDFKSFLLNLVNVWSKKEQLAYTSLATELDEFGQSLLGPEKEEFDRYRMILGPQLIALPE